MKYFHQKEIVFRASMAYNEQDFEEVVKDFIEGEYSEQVDWPVC